MRFGVDDEGWIEVRADLPRDGLSAEEVVEALWRVGRAADRWELLWTGKDVL